AHRSLLIAHCCPYGTFFFLTSTLLPIMPPMMPPAAAPIRPPFTLSWLVVAPITAPAAAPIAASRLVFFSVTVRPSEATLPLLVPALRPDDARRRVGELDVRSGDVLPVRDP